MKKLIVLIIILAGAAGGYFWLENKSDTPEVGLTLYGNVDIRQISLAFNGSGRILSAQAQEGDTVAAGEVLAQLDTESIRLQVQQAQAQIEAQKQSILLLRNGARPEEIAQAKSQVDVAQAAEDQAVLTLKRLQNLAKASQGQNVSEHDLDAARLSLKAAEATTEIKRQSLKLVQSGNREETIAAAQAQLQVYQAQLAQLEYQIKQGQLVAPVDAVVRSRLHEPGDMTSASSPVYTLAMLHPKWVRLYVTETELGNITIGQQAQIYTDSQPVNRIEGRISYISSVAEFTPKSVQMESLRTSLVYEIRVSTDDPADTLRLGQPVTVKFNVDLP